MEYKSFDEMPLWQRAHVLALRVHEASSSFPKQEAYALTSQIRRAAVSIPAKVAEAFGCYHYRDKLNSYYHSRGSANELRSHLMYARDVGYLVGESFDRLAQELDAVLQQLNAVIKTIRQRLVDHQ